MKKLERAILPNTPLRGICSPLMILERDLRGDGSHRMELSAALFMEVTEEGSCFPSVLLLWGIRDDLEA